MYASVRCSLRSHCHQAPSEVRLRLCYTGGDTDLVSARVLFGSSNHHADVGLDQMFIALAGLLASSWS